MSRSNRGAVAQVSKPAVSPISKSARGLISFSAQIRRSAIQQTRRSALLLAFYGDDFTGSTDALEQLTLAGIRTVLFIKPPTRRQLARFKNVQAVGVAGITRSLPPDAMGRELRPALTKLKALGARHVHYKVCSTFDSSPEIGSIGWAIDLGAEIFKSRFVPLLVAAPALGRHCVFGNLFARLGIGSNGEIHRLDRHPSISQHPITPMQEADLRRHLAKQTKKRIGLFDVLKLALPATGGRMALERIVSEGAEVVLFDALYQEQLQSIGKLIDGYASARRRPLFSVGSSGIEMALAAYWKRNSNAGADVRRLITETTGSRLLTSAPTDQILVGSGSCSPVTSRQIAWALRHGFAEVELNALALNADPTGEIRRCSGAATAFLDAGRSVIIHTTKNGASKRIVARLKNRTAQVLGCALGSVIWATLKRSPVQRLCVAGGDTSSFAALALGIEALEMISPLTPGAPLCRAHALPPSPINGLEVVVKGGQVGGDGYFGIVKRGRA